ncbi:hypothetical protein HanHA300_Chr07g0260221 [Helianthus annuus]|nr:hypothetical protein HanHA300_Chr07g0260221 [Helianthus annuus]KAJ0564681.1 hypothetical protein HanHA89_Chr07g0277001 [Helianthus annuus]
MYIFLTSYFLDNNMVLQYFVLCISANSFIICINSQLAGAIVYYPSFRDCHKSSTFKLWSLNRKHGYWYRQSMQTTSGNGCLRQWRRLWCSSAAMAVAVCGGVGVR